MKEAKIKRIEDKVNARLALFIKPSVLFSIGYFTEDWYYYKLEVFGVWKTDGKVARELFDARWRQMVLEIIQRMITYGLFTEDGWDIPEDNQIK